MKKRYYVEPLDNLGTVDPPPPRDRTWTVIDRVTGGCVADLHQRAEARAEAHLLNSLHSAFAALATLNNTAQKEP